jgi:hypothetical protein
MNATVGQTINLVLTRRLPRLLEELYGGPPYSREQIMQAFPISRSTVLDYVKENGFPKGSYIVGESGEDGIHVEKKGTHWYLYKQERGFQSLAFECDDKSKLIEAMVDLMVYLSGATGPIEFSSSFQLSPMDEHWR